MEKQLITVHSTLHWMLKLKPVLITTFHLYKLRKLSANFSTTDISLRLLTLKARGGPREMSRLMESTPVSATTGPTTEDTMLLPMVTKQSYWLVNSITSQRTARLWSSSTSCLLIPGTMSSWEFSLMTSRFSSTSTNTMLLELLPSADRPPGQNSRKILRSQSIISTRMPP